MTNAPIKSIKDVVTDFLSSAPSLDEIASFKLPETLQDYAQMLLEHNRTETLTLAEQADMGEFRQIDHLLTLVKAKARLKQQ